MILELVLAEFDDCRNRPRKLHVRRKRAEKRMGSEVVVRVRRKRDALGNDLRSAGKLKSEFRSRRIDE